MVKIEPFAVEQWMDEYETTAKYNIAESCCASISIDDLQSLSNNKSVSPLQTSSKLTYGAIRGSESLRSNLAKLYPVSDSILSPENILVTPGGILANFLLLYTLVGPGDHVVCHYPTYQQLYSVPKSLGAEVSLWKAKREDDWRVNIEELKALIRPNTKLIIVNNPQNPTSAVTSKEALLDIIEIAKKQSIYVLADEVYRPLFHGLDKKEWPPSLLSLGYERSLVTGSMSKAYSLAGIRVGWIASLSRDIIENCAHSRDYTTISTSQIDDRVASFALDSNCVGNLLERNLQLARKNLAILKAFIDEHEWACDWVVPRAGTTGFVRFSRDGKPVDDVELCKTLHGRIGVLFAPGRRCFGEEFKGYVRIGYVCETEVLEAGLQKLVVFMKDGFEKVPLA